MPTNNICEKIKATLATGENNAVCQAYLCQLCKTNARTVRATIERLRLSGVVICSSDAGYFFPENVLELRRYVARSLCRVRSGWASVEPAVKLLRAWGQDIEFAGLTLLEERGERRE